jgi:hypothetical protein
VNVHDPPRPIIRAMEKKSPRPSRLQCRLQDDVVMCEHRKSIKTFAPDPVAWLKINKKVSRLLLAARRRMIKSFSLEIAWEFPYQIYCRSRFPLAFLWPLNKSIKSVLKPIEITMRDSSFRDAVPRLVRRALTHTNPHCCA